MRNRGYSPAERGRIEELLPLFHDHWPTQRRIHNAALVEPWLHGEGLPGLSGLYAIINGFQIALARRRPLAPSQITDLLEAGLAFVAAHASVERCTRSGMRLELWLRLVTALQRRAQRVHSAQRALHLDPSVLINDVEPRAKHS